MAQFTIELTIGGTESVQGFYSSSTNPTLPVKKHQADGISTNNFRWISRQVIKNWHTAEQHSPSKKQTSWN